MNSSRCMAVSIEIVGMARSFDIDRALCETYANAFADPQLPKKMSQFGPRVQGLEIVLPPMPAALRDIGAPPYEVSPDCVCMVAP
jgi:hypothetical protein